MQNTTPVWSPDGKWIAYASLRDGHSNLYRKRSDGSGAEEVLLENDQADTVEDWSPDGKYLLYSHGTNGMDTQLWAVALEEEPEAMDDRGPCGCALRRPAFSRWQVAGL